MFSELEEQKGNVRRKIAQPDGRSRSSIPHDKHIEVGIVCVENGLVAYRLHDRLIITAREDPPGFTAEFLEGWIGLEIVGDGCTCLEYFGRGAPVLGRYGLGTGVSKALFIPRSDIENKPKEYVMDPGGARVGGFQMTWKGLAGNAFVTSARDNLLGCDVYGGTGAIWGIGHAFSGAIAVQGARATDHLLESVKQQPGEECTEDTAPLFSVNRVPVGAGSGRSFPWDGAIFRHPATP